MAEKYERHLSIPKHKLLRCPSNTTMKEFLQFAIQIHCNNLGLIGIKILAVSSLTDVGDAYVIGFECIDIVDEIKRRQMQTQLQEMASNDIDNYFKNLVGDN